MPSDELETERNIEHDIVIPLAGKRYIATAWVFDCRRRPKRESETPGRQLRADKQVPKLGFQSGYHQRII